MKRNIYWGALALVLGLASAGTGRAQSAVDTSSADQAASSATADISAGADSASTAADSSASGSTSVDSDTSGSVSSDTQSSNSDSQSTSSESATTQSVGDTSASADTQAGASVDTQSSNVPAPATPSASADADASVQAGADINASANQGTAATQTPPATPNTSANADAGSTGQNQNADVNASAQGQANLNGNAAAQQNLSAGLQFGQATSQGLALNTVARNSFFYSSGLRPGDVLVSYGGRPIRSRSDFSRWAVYQPGQRVPVIILRDGRRETIYVTYHHHHGGAIQHEGAYAPQPGGAYLGLTFDPYSQNGALVRSVAPGSPADQAGIRPGHLIVAVNGQQVANHQEVIGFVAAQQPGTQVDLAVSHSVVLAPRPNVQGSVYQSNVRVAPAAVAPPAPTAPAPVTGTVETGVYQRDTADVRVDGDAVARPADADRDGRVLDGDGRAGPRERAGLGGRRR